MLKQEQVEIIKKELISHIEKNFPKDKKDFAIEQIDSMNSTQLEDFLKKNNITLDLKDFGKSNFQKCIFCSIVLGEIESYKIEENKDSIAILEINPLSRGHVIIIPKEHINSSDKIPPSIFSFARDIAKRLKFKLNSKNIEINSANIFGHEIINVVPVYDKESIKERKLADKKDLEELKKILIKEKEKKPIKKEVIKRIKDKEYPWLPKRIP